MHHRLKALILLAGALGTALTGCSGGSFETTPDNIQARLDVFSALSEMHHQTMVMPSYLRDIITHADMLTDTAEDADALQKLAKQLAKARRDKEKIQLLTREMTQLIPLPEKYSNWQLNEPSSESTEDNPPSAEG